MQRKNEKIVEAEEAYSKGSLEGCILLVNQIILEENNNLDALMLRARLYYNWQKWGDALNDLNRIIELDANHQMALNYKKMVLDILTYWNKDSFNP